MAVAPGVDMVAHHFTIDVEEYFQVAALEPYVSRSTWRTRESRVARQMELLLGLLARHRARATCFVLGWPSARQISSGRLRSRAMKSRRTVGITRV
jgi:hypothetical protein